LFSVSKEIQVWIDKGLIDNDEKKVVLKSLENNGIMPIVDKLPVENAVMWSKLEVESSVNMVNQSMLFLKNI
jgi:hypothetical protein